MRKLLTIFALMFALAATSSAESDYLRVCYYTNWSQYRPGAGKFSMSDLDPFLCTHLIYSFIEIGSNNQLKLREWNGEQLIADSMILKQANPNLKISAAVGGWNFGTERFTAVCKDEATMKHFAKTTVDFLRKYEFDGIDMDWEYPGSRGSPPEDFNNFPKLGRIMMEEFEKDPSPKDRLILTAGVSAGEYTIKSGYDIPALCGIFDYIHLMSYDFHGGSFESITGHNSPLYGNTGIEMTKNFNVNNGLQFWINGGCSRKKLVLGIPLYGRTFTLTNAANNGYNASASGPGKAGPYTREAGTLSYSEICSQVKSGKLWYEPEVSAPSLAIGDQWIGFDDKTSVRTKVQYMKDQGLAGTMIWSVDMDDFSSICGEKYPLMRTIYKELEGENSPACFVSPTTEAVTWWPDPNATDPPSSVTCWYPLEDGEEVPTAPPQTTTQAPAATTTKKPAGTTTTEKPQEPSTEGPAATTTQQNNNNNGEFTCTVAGIHPDPEDCAYYYQCDAGLKAYHKQCPAGLLFNAETRTCDWASNVQC